MVDTSALISAILRVIHPELYRAGLAIIRAQGEDPCLLLAIKIWASVFNGVTAISNCQTPVHVDNQSRATWFDILATVRGDSDLTFQIPEVGLHLRYTSGTIVAICGSFLLHSVPPSCEERLCYAYFMWDLVHEHAGVPTPHWVRRSDVGT
jgi:hypothetical protein